MQEYNDFETKTREELFEEKKIGIAVLYEQEGLDESEMMKILLIVPKGENGPSENEPGLRLLKTVEELRGFLENGYEIHDWSRCVYDEFFLVKVDDAPEHIKNHFLEVNKIDLENIVKAIPKLSTSFIEALLKTKSILTFSSGNVIESLAEKLQTHARGAYLLNMFFHKEDNRFARSLQKRLIFKYFPDKLNLFENDSVVGYLKNKDKCIFIDDKGFNIILIHVDLNILINKNHKLDIALESLAFYLETLAEQVHFSVGVGIEKIDLAFQLKDDDTDSDLSSVKMYFNLSKECVFNKEKLEEFLESYFDFITTLQHMGEDEMLTDIHAWIPSQLRSMQLELTLKDKKCLKPKSKI